MWRIVFLICVGYAASLQEVQGLLQREQEQHRWWGVIDSADQLVREFPESPFAQEAPFLMAEAYLELDQLALANQCLTQYLNQTLSPKRFEEAIRHKFDIAEQFRQGAKLPLFGSHKMPKLLSAKEEAIQIYDEVITTFPHHEMTVHSLLGKAKIQAEMEEFRTSIETLDLLIRRFPKHDLAAESYLEKVRVFLVQCQQQSPDLSLLDLAEVTVRKFHLAFPREPRLAEAEQVVRDMQEIFAGNLLEIGRFFAKTKKFPAAGIYLRQVVSKYPATQAAEEAEALLDRLEAAGRL